MERVYGSQVKGHGTNARTRTDGRAGVLPSNENLVLASASPRRAEILRQVGWRFRVQVADVDETQAASESAVAYVERLARLKALTVAREVQTRADALATLVLGADTSVVVDNEVLGKPRDEEDARRMLTLLQGRWHEVLTGVALVRIAGEGATDTSRVSVAHERTRVRFAEMSTTEIDWYVATGEFADKAGAYAVQGRAALFIAELRGDYWNVVGLPIHLVYKLMRKT